MNKIPMNIKPSSYPAYYGKVYYNLAVRYINKHADTYDDIHVEDKHYCILGTEILINQGKATGAINGLHTVNVKSCVRSYLHKKSYNYFNCKKN